MFKAPAREKILQGATILADAVRVTLGPQSRSVLIEKSWGKPIVCNDGVTIAKEIELKDREANLGAQIIRQAAEQTGEAVGDGTSTSTVLAHGLFAEGLKNLAAGASGIELKHGMDRGMRAVVEALRTQSRPVTTRKEMAQVAALSAHNDTSLGELVADAMERVGGDGVVSVEEAKGTETSIEVVEGMQLDRGYLSSYFVTNAEKMECVLESPRILLYDRRISAIKDLIPLLEQLTKSGQPLLIVADDLEADVLATLVVNKLRGILNCVAIKAPGYGDRRKEILGDIAVLTGGQVVAEDLGLQLPAVKLADLGRAERIVVDKDHTTLIGSGASQEAIAARCRDIRRQLEKTTSSYDREMLEKRLAKLSGGVAVLHVGAPSEAELKSRKEALDDAISATKAAIAEGIVPGGGLALLRAIPAVEKLEVQCAGDELTGLRILKKALEIPARQIAENSGYDAGMVIGQMRAEQDARGFDAATGEMKDLFAAGIVDPVKVVRTALENAVSVAGVLLLTEATLTEVPEAKTPREPALVEP